ncbi:hypothetical protein ABH925_001385 [Streptacidiphilus sp. EB129]
MIIMLWRSETTEARMTCADEVLGTRNAVAEAIFDNAD